MTSQHCFRLPDGGKQRPEAQQLGGLCTLGSQHSSTCSFALLADAAAAAAAPRTAAPSSPAPQAALPVVSEERHAQPSQQPIRQAASRKRKGSLERGISKKAPSKWVQLGEIQQMQAVAARLERLQAREEQLRASIARSEDANTLLRAEMERVQGGLLRSGETSTALLRELCWLHKAQAAPASGLAAAEAPVRPTGGPPNPTPGRLGEALTRQLSLHA